MRIQIALLLTFLLLAAGPLAAAAPTDHTFGGPDGPPGDDASEPVHLYLRAGTFDPVTDDSPGPGYLHARSTHPYYVIQFDGPIQRVWREAAAEAGAELLGYLPDFGYFARISADDLDGVRELEHLRYLGPAHPAFLIDPGLWNAPLYPIDLAILTWDASYTGPVAQLVLELGGGLYYAEGRMVTARLSPLTALSLAADPGTGIAWVERHVWPEPMLNNDARTVKARQMVDGPYQSSTNSLWSYRSSTDTFQGTTGKNVTVAVGDSGLDDSHPAFSGRIAQYYDYGNNGDADYNGHGTHVSGIVLGDGSWRSSDTSGVDGKYIGVAPEAKLVVLEVFQSWQGPVTWNRDSTRSGATISSNSWGTHDTAYWGVYTTQSQAYDSHTRDADSWRAGDQPLLFSFSAGNFGQYGSNTLSPPATAKNILCVGATGNDKWGSSHNTIWGASSRGPTDDGRLKPDVVMPGHVIDSTRSMDSGAHSGWYRTPDGGSSYVRASGTSMAAPGVAGAAAVVEQHLEDHNDMVDPSPAMVKATLINGARPISGYEYPGMAQGWGLVDLSRSLLESDTYHFYRFDQEVELDTSSGEDSVEYFFMVEDDKPFKVSLVWTDPGGTTSSSKHLINDLDLVLRDPDGKEYLGNDFNGGQSQENLTDNADRLNNVEGFLINIPKEGIWSVKVRAYNVPGGPQDFALVVSGNVEKGHVDLKATSLQASPSGMEEYQPVRLAARLENAGNRIVALFDYKVEQILPGGTVQVIAEGNMSDLVPETPTTLAWDFTGMRGTHTLRLTLDPEGLLMESNETNNVVEVQYFFKGYGVKLSVEEPDLNTDPGEMVQFNLSIRNRGNVEDTITVSFPSPPPGWTAQLTSDSFSLASGELTAFSLQVIPPTNATAGETAVISLTATSVGNATKTRTQALTIMVNQIFGIDLSTTQTYLRLLPGAEGTYTLILENPGNGFDTYEFILPHDMEPGWWPALPESRVILRYRSQVDVIVLLTAPNPALAGSDMDFVFKIRSTESGMERSAVLSADVLQFFENEYEVRQRESEADCGVTILIPMSITNNGNGPVEYVMDVGAPGEEWNASFDHSQLTIPGYGWAPTNLSFTVPVNAINQTYNLSIVIMPSGGPDFQYDFNFAACQYHDLSIEVVSEVPTITQGEDAEVTVRLTNRGNGIETAKLLVPELPAFWSYSVTQASVDIDPFSNIELVVTLETNPESPGGSYDVSLLVRYGSAPERRETATASVVLLTRPDLVLDQGSISISESEPEVGTVVKISTSVRNDGETTAQDVYVQFYVDDQPVGHVIFISSLEPGGLENVSTTWTVDSAGYHRVSVDLDVTGDVDETSENNNEASMPLEAQDIELRTSPGFPSLVALAGLLVVAVAVYARRRRPPT